MPRLLVANDIEELLVNATAMQRKGLGWWSQRLLWFMQDSDILVLPEQPDPVYLEYVARITGTRLDTVRIVIPPADRHGTESVSPERLRDPALKEAVERAIDGRAVDAIVPLCPSTGVAALARSLRLEHVLPGAAFMSQGGGSLANSKVVFRQIAAGSRVPIAEGGVASEPWEAEALIAGMFARGYSVMVKRDFDQGCKGNEVLSPQEGVEPLGARRGHVLSGATAITSYLSENWSWLTNGGRHRVVVERYHPQSRALFAEFDLSDRGVTLAGHGELFAVPMPDGQNIPVQHASSHAIGELVDAGHRLSEALRAMGYRGVVSADAILTPDGEILFTEHNGRITGSTHIYAVVGARVVGPEAARHRVFVNREGWTAPSLQVAIERLDTAGLAYDPAAKTGVILTCAYNEMMNYVTFTVVAEDLGAARRWEERMWQLSPRAW